MQNNPIGIFDSGVGGLTVVKEVQKILPNESIYYFADSGNCPYGSKTESETLRLTQKNIGFLLNQGCKLIVVACNTVTAVAIDILRAKYKVPFIGMEPALKPASIHTKAKRIGVLATENTFNGRLFKETFQKYANGIEVHIQPGNGLVELVEKGNHKGEHARKLLEKYLNPMLAIGIDTLVLGCTHYPFFSELITSITHNEVKIIDPARAVARQTKKIINEFDIAAPKETCCEFTFFTTGEKRTAKNLLQQIMIKTFKIKQMTGEISPF
ncbi:MAG: glutamate racemase [Desulfobacteraceae bacterium]|nr:glutamate racemase [Desulfobacteraceae bacterium]